MFYQALPAHESFKPKEESADSFEVTARSAISQEARAGPFHHQPAQCKTCCCC